MTLSINGKTYDTGELIAYHKRLEKENAELKKACDETQELLDKQIEATYKLDKENAELKEDINKIAFARGELEQENAELKAVERMALYSKMSDRLAKAKEILREYIRINLLPPIERNFDDEVKLFKEAEQFLKEVEE